MKPTDLTPPKRLAHLAKDPRGYPIIAVVSRSRRPNKTYFSQLSEPRKLVLATFDWCAVCGLPFGNEPRWQVMSSPTWTWINSPDPARYDFKGYGEAPVHEICAVYAAQVCPHLISPSSRLTDSQRKGQTRNPAVECTGFAHTAEVKVFESALQPGCYVLHFRHDQPIGHFTYTQPAELTGRYQALLAAETIPVTTPAQRELITMFNKVSNHDGEPVVEAALVAGAAFAHDVFRLPSLDEHDPESYRTAATTFLNTTAIRALATDGETSVSRALGQWLLSRGDDLPTILQRWRQDARQRRIRRTTTGPRSKQQRHHKRRKRRRR